VEFYYKTKDTINSLTFEQVHKIVSEHEWLNTSDFYTFTNKHDLRLHFVEHTIEEVLFMCPSGKYVIKGYFFNRQSDKAVVCIPPFGAETKDIIRFAGVFNEYDVLLLEYRNASSSKPLSLSPFLLTPEAVIALAQGVEQAFSWIAHRKDYSTIIGHGQCYGAWILLEAQASGNNRLTFDKLIIDSCPLSLYSVFENMCTDPTSVLSLGKKQSSIWVKAPLKIPLLRKLLMKISTLLFSDIAIKHCVENISSPILFIHGTQDYLVNQKQFDTLFATAQDRQSAALITPFKHLHHSLKSKELYRHYVLSFINQ